MSGIYINVKNTVIMSLEFGKKYKTRHFYVLKASKSLSKKEMALLREGMPEDARRVVKGRVSLPYIKVGTLSGSWAVEYAVGVPMFHALDSLTPAIVDGQHVLTGIEGANVEVIANMMHVDTTVKGDEAYIIGKKKLLDEYIERESVRRNAAEDEGKSGAKLTEESDAILDEMESKEKNAAAILEIGKQADAIEGKEALHD